MPWALLIISFTGLSLLSWGFVDIHSPFPHIQPLFAFASYSPHSATFLYITLFAVLFLGYILLLRKVRENKVNVRFFTRLVVASVFILFIGFPGFSYDVFNYMATAKVAFFWRENPYVVMPIEIPNEPMLAYMQASNKVALYGPAWIILTAIPHFAGVGNPLVTLFLFKVLEMTFYAGMLLLLWHISGKRLWAVAFFALNPVVLTETILSGHNDVVMMFFALASFYLVQRKKYVLSIAALGFSIFIKYATVLLVPIYFYVVWRQIRKEKISWNSVWIWCAAAMYGAFLLSPIREEIYAWYFIWPLTFLALIPGESFFVWLSYGFTFGLPYRFAPFIYWTSWIGLTPLVKKIVTFVPALVTGSAYGFYKKIR